MSELVPANYYDPVSRKTAKQLSRIQQQALVSQAELAAREQNAAHVVGRRIDNGYQLAAQTVHNATRLNRLVTQVSRDNPGLEATLRSIEDTVAFASQSVIYQYMTR